ncbi:MAG: BrnT family toxin [Bacteroidales bacterium]|nr:BrnT family toxin [Bacteroidales bacterium]
MKVIGYTVTIFSHSEWNKNKDKANSRNHGVSFDEAKTVFYDEDAIRKISSLKPTKREQMIYFERLK